MEKVELPEKSLTKYRIIRTLVPANEGHGSCNIYLGKTIEAEGKYVVLKVFNYLPKAKKAMEFHHDFKEKVDSEADSLIKLADNGVMRYIGHGADVLREDGVEKYEVYYLASEYLPNGILFDVAVKSPIPEPIAAAIFCKLVKIVHNIHSKGYCHLDIKLENIMFNRDCEPTLIDFEYATKLEGVGDGKLKEYKGTSFYKAPQITEFKPFYGTQADIFSLGVVLFAMTASRFPFDTSSERDQLYKLISAEEYQNYWTKMRVLLSSELKILITGLFLKAPSERLTISEILNSPWIQSMEIPTDAELRDWIRANAVPN